MKLGELSSKHFYSKAAAKSGINIDIGLFAVNLRANNDCFLSTFQAFYTEFPILEDGTFIDFHIHLKSPASHRRWFKPQNIIRLEGREPFQPFGVDHAYPLFEWGLNWCIARFGHQNLMLHAAVLEKHGRAIIFPALPGSGKSTLAAALAQSGWRFLSDEFCIIRPEDGHALPIPRPTPLKNSSIEVIRNFAPQAFIGPLFDKTRKGTIGHLRAPAASIERMKESAIPFLVIFPQFQTNSALTLTPLKKTFAFLKLATNAFNYEVQGDIGFKLVRDIIDRCDCYNLCYSDLNEVISALDQLIDERL